MRFGVGQKHQLVNVELILGTLCFERWLLLNNTLQFISSLCFYKNLPLQKVIRN